MNKYKAIFCICFALLLLVLSIVPCFAHSGRTDSNGGHWDHSNGTYHYHNNGNSSSGSQYQSNFSTPSTSNSPSKSVSSQNQSNSGCNDFFDSVGNFLGTLLIILVIIFMLIIMKHHLDS